MATPSVNPHEAFRGYNPATNTAMGEYLAATPGEVGAAGEWAWEAFQTRPGSTDRATLLETLAASLERDADAVIGVVAAETALAEARVRGELARTTFTMRMFAALIRGGSWVEAEIDHGDPARTPMPKPDIRRMLVPLGPVAVFGASNFPLAYGALGGDTASALAGGCPVIVKGHAAHPATGAHLARLAGEAVRAAGLHRAFFQYLPAGGARDIAVGTELVLHPRVRAVGFTGSVPGGTAIVRLAASRPEPIPVFAEMGSVNPVFVMPRALSARGRDIAALLAASATNSGGQMCTCPGVIVAPEPLGEFADHLRAAFAATSPVVMLTPRIAAAYHARLSAMVGAGAAPVVPASPGRSPTAASPSLLQIGLDAFLASSTLREECFGPCTLLVRVPNVDAFAVVAQRMEGSLTATVHADPDDFSRTRPLMTLLADRAGRLIVNGVPTGVEVSPAMVHSGPFPACSRPESTAVGAAAIRRWCRPVCYQNVPQALLPEELRQDNPRRIGRTVGGVWMPPPR